MLPKSNSVSCVWSQVFFKCVSEIEVVGCVFPQIKPRIRYLCVSHIQPVNVVCLIFSQPVLSLVQRWSHPVFVCFRWPYWLAWRCQRISNSRSSFFPPSVPWIQTYDVMCSLSLLPSGPFPIMSDGIYPSPILLKVPSVLDTLQRESLSDNLGQRNKSELILAYKYNDGGLWTSVQMWLELLWIAILFSYARFLPCDLQDSNNTYVIIPAFSIPGISTRRKTQPEIYPWGLKPNSLRPVKTSTLCSKVILCSKSWKVMKITPPF